MTSREKNLLFLMIAMAFVAVNFLAFRVFYQPRMKALTSATATAEREVRINESEAASLDTIQDDKQWLERFEPKPTTSGKAQTRIQQLGENEAVRAGLTIKDKRFGNEVVDESLSYHRVRYEMKVNGAEASVYRWLDRLHNPNEFRIVTFVRLNPQRDDATRADCQIYLDQWFVPEGGQS